MLLQLRGVKTNFALLLPLLLLLQTLKAVSTPYHSQSLPLSARGGLREFSVVYTDRAVNHMSTTFQTVMKDLHFLLKDAYKGSVRSVVIPGSGTFGMESVARQLIPVGKSEEPEVMVLRLGFFSYRWTDIFEQTGIALGHRVVKAKPVETNDSNSNSDSKDLPPVFAPPPLKEVLEEIKKHKPSVFFAPHVETSTGILLPDDYIKSISVALKQANPNAFFVLDGIAAGFHWIDFEKTGIDFYLTAPQKGWSSPASSAIVVMNKRGLNRVKETKSSSMALNLGKWLDVTESYLPESEGGKIGPKNPDHPGFAYYTTMPTDALQLFRDNARETQKYGWEKIKKEFGVQGKRVYELLEAKFGLRIVAAEGFRAPGVVVAYAPSSDSSSINMVKEFKQAGLQIAAGVPFQLGEKGIATFRVGLFGLDKIYGGGETIGLLEKALEGIRGLGGSHSGKEEL